MCGSLGVDSTLNNGGEQATVCSSSDFAGWSDFPKGLHVLLVDHDHTSAADIRLKLEKMDYIVSLFSNEKDALEAIASRTENFHVAIIEVDTDNSQESFRFLETAKGFPTLMVSNGNCLSTMMKCIALGAAEILQKPLSEDKLKNIWQHVVHKAFNAGESALCKSLKPIRETMFTMLRMQTETANSENLNQRNEEDTVKEPMNQSVQDGLSAPTTPQLEQGIRSSNDRDSHDQCSAEQECEMTCNDTSDAAFMFSYLESKSADNAYNELINEYDSHEQEISMAPEEIAVGAMDSCNCSSKEGRSFEPKKSISSDSKNKCNGMDQVNKGTTLNHNSNNHSSKNNKKKMKVDWTPELHRRFVQAVEQLGIDQAIPSKILAMMKAEGLTRHNIASHLQKYRMHRKHALPKDEDRRWLHRRDAFSRVYAHKPLVAAPPSHSNLGYPPIYPAWGHPNLHPSGYQMWGHTGFYPWHSTQGSWPWKTYNRMYADAWGCPIFPQQNKHPIPHVPNNFSRNHGIKEFQNHSHGIVNLHEPLPGEEVIDEAVKEAMSKPWLPLPIGLKPPSTDSVLAELQRQGIRSIPPLA